MIFIIFSSNIHIHLQSILEYSQYIYIYLPKKSRYVNFFIASSFLICYPPPRRRSLNKGRCFFLCLILYLDINIRPPIFSEFSISPFFEIKIWKIRYRQTFEIEDIRHPGIRYPFFSNNRSLILINRSSISNKRSSIIKKTVL